MRILERTISTVFTAVLFFTACGIQSVYAQKPDTTATQRGGRPQTIVIPDSLTETTFSDTTAPVPVPVKKAKYDFRYHSPKKASWMSAALPSLGQFYNRRYWKPPIIYAALGVSIYFLVDNQLKFMEARNSYRARLNIAGFTVAPKYTNLSAEQILADRDFYRTNRDYSIIAIAAVYALNVIDAAVDAHLRTFDVGDDLSMKIRPSFRFNTATAQNGFAPTPGIAWTLKF